MTLSQMTKSSACHIFLTSNKSFSPFGEKADYLDVTLSTWTTHELQLCPRENSQYQNL